MTEEQFIELMAMNLFQQHELKEATLDAEYERQTWDEITRKERTRFRKLAATIIGEQ